jgi:hypothetical protein
MQVPSFYFLLDTVRRIEMCSPTWNKIHMKFDAESSWKEVCIDIRQRWEESNEIDLEGICCDGVKWIELAQNSIQ